MRGLLGGSRRAAYPRAGVIALMGVVLLAGLATAPARAATGTAFVRVNQIGYASASQAKRAYLMASALETGATFSVKDASGAVVYSAPIGADLGKWSTSYPHVYAIDFSQVTTAGTYAITVTGPVAAASPSFRIDTGPNLYSGALANSLSFYQNERDGPNFIASALRTAPGHLNDQNAMTYLTPNVNSSGRFSGDLTPLGVTVNAAGGWWTRGTT